MSAKDRIYIGGLLRCCIESIKEAPDGTEGEVIGCKFHNDPGEPQAVFRDGAWHWVGPPEVTDRAYSVKLESE